MAEAMEWVARITSVAVFMVGPMVLARWWEGRSGWLTFVATLAGLAGGLTYLILITSSRPKDDP